MQTSARIEAEPFKKIAVISHDYCVRNIYGLQDYTEHFTKINSLCDEQGCDTILYSLFTWDNDSMQARSQTAIFKALANVNRVILEVWQKPENPEQIEVWWRDQKTPTIAHQRFATSSSPNKAKQAFLDDWLNRLIDKALLVICGETNITSTIRGSDEFYDPFGFSERLLDSKVKLILNPIHDYMTRYEMRIKRRHYSLHGRTVISVWNQGKGKESYLPWTVFHNGEERTGDVTELPTPFSDRPDIRIGIVYLTSL